MNSIKHLKSTTDQEHTLIHSKWVVVSEDEGPNRLFKQLEIKRNLDT